MMKTLSTMTAGTWAIAGLVLLPSLFSVFFLLVPPQPFAQAPDPDLNNDGTVTGKDVSIVARCLGNNAQNKPNCDFPLADTDGDGDVDHVDLQFVVDHLGETGFPIGNNVTPLADAGPDQTVLVGTTVHLDGSGSTDDDGDPLTFLWTITSTPAGSAATLSDPTSINPTLVADTAGSYVIELVVNDGTIDSVADAVTITTSNSPPVAEAGSDQSVQVTDVVQLDGSASSDVDGDSLTFAWSFGATPNGSTAALSDPTLINPTFVVDLSGTYVVLLTVNDGTVDSAVDVVTITTVNSEPMAEAGPDQTIFVTQTVFLDGTNSSDVDGDPLTYLWSLASVPLGSVATLSDPTSATPNFTIDLPGTYVAQLIVNDGTVDSVPDTMVVNTQNSRPVAEAGADHTVSIGDTVQLDGTNSTDVDGDSLTFQWALTTVPPNSVATLSDPVASEPTFVADLPGTYVVQLIVNDGTDDSLPSTIVVTANSPPVADPGPDQIVPAGTTVTLDGSGSSDPDGEALTFAWTITDQPPGGTATLSDSTLSTPTFIANVVGSYVVQLIVNDGEDSSAPDSVLITAENTAPLAQAGPDQTVAKNTMVQLDGNASSDPNGDPLTFAWSLLQQPPTSSVALSDPAIVNPTFVADVAGDYVIQLIVHDGTVDSDPATVTITVTNAPPVLDPIGNQTIPLGQTLAFTLTGSDPDGDAVTFSATPLPLPANMTINGGTGEVAFSPDATQVGDIILTFLVSDGTVTDSETVTITVQGAPPGGTTGLSGRLLDTNDFVSGGGTETPIVGATVSIIGTGITATTDSQGFFTLTSLPAAGTQVFDIDATTANQAPDGSDYAGFREQIALIEHVTTVVDRPFFLPRIDPNSQMTVNGTPVTTVDPVNTTVVSNPAIGVTLTVPANTAKNADGTNYTGALSISEVPDALAPAALPTALQPGLLITIQPPGVSFATPVPITFPNVDGLSPGTEADIWSLDPETGTFVIVGALLVSVDGTSLDTISGGVVAADWHCPCPIGPGPGNSGGAGSGGGGGGGGGGSGDPNGGGDPGDPPPPNPGNDPKEPTKCPGGSRTELCSGSLEVTHALASYQSLGTTRAPRFVYRSRTADPRPVIFNDPTIPVRSAVPLAMSSQLTIAGVDQGIHVFTDTSGLNESQDETVRQAIQFDASSMETGSYPYTLTLTNHFAESAVSGLVSNTLLVNNEQNSPFGAGWIMEGLQRVRAQTDGIAVLSDGLGGTRRFTPSGEVALEFDGTDDFVSVASAPALNPTTTMTIEAWVRAEAFSSFRMGIAGTWNDLTANERTYMMWMENGRIFFFLSHNGSSFPNVFTPLPLETGSWHHVAGTFDGTTLRLYLDGGLVDETVSAGPIATNNKPFFIGRVDGGDFGSKFFHGQIGDVRLWNVSRSATEIQQNMHARLAGNESGLAGYWPVNEGSGDILADQTSNGNNGLRSDGPGDQPAWVAQGPPITDGIVATSYTSPDGDFSFLRRESDGTFTRTMKDGTLIQFDANGRQTAEIDRNGNTTAYSYDGQGRLDTITDPVGLVTTLAYTGTHLTSITDPANRVTSFTHDPEGNLETITDPDLSTRHFTYDTRHLMTTQTSKRGFLTQYEYDVFGRNAKAIRPDGASIQFTAAEVAALIDPNSGLGTSTSPAAVIRPTDITSTFTNSIGGVTTYNTDKYGRATITQDPLGRETLVSRNFNGDPVLTTSPNGALTRRTYDDRGNVLTRTEAEGQPEERTMAFAYDPTFSLLTQVTDPAGKVTTIQRDANGNPERVINPFLDERVRTFNAQGLVLTDTDENGKTTTFTYDANGNVETVTNAEGHVTRFIRDLAGNVTSLIEGEGTPEQRTRAFSYDDLNRLTTATDGTPAITQFRYDSQGNVQETELPTGEIEVRTYEELNRVSSVNNPIRGLTQFTYDLNGNLEQSTNALNDSTTLEYDVANQLTTIMDALGGEQSFTYDVEGNVETFTDARNQTTTFAYDLLNRQTTRSNSLTQDTVFTYDTRNNLVTTTDPKNQVITRSYDDLSRLTSLVTPDNTIGVGYDAVGNATLVTDNDSEVGFTYDGLNRVLTANTVDQGAQPAVTLTSVYDAVRNRVSLTDTGPGTVAYEYDQAGRLTKVTTPALQDVLLAYDATGRLETTLYPNGVASTRSYDTQGRLDSLAHTPGTNPSFADFGYTYNPVGNITSIVDNFNVTQTRAFTYDALQRLTIGGTTTMAETYNYDLVGNRTTSFLSTTHTHDTTNRLTEDDAFTYSYDANGNLETKTSKANPTEVTTYTWNAQDQLTQIAFPNSTTATYKYDGLGRRIEKNVDGFITRYVYDGEDILLEYSATNTFVAHYSHGDQVDQPLVVQRAGLGFFYYHSDHLGSIIHLTNTSGAIANSYVYDSYGRMLSVAETVPQPFSYTGRELDTESGLYYYRARYYDPEAGRFLSEDPIGFRGKDTNMYRYVFNDPINFIDPDGLQAANPGQAVADAVALVNGNLNLVLDTQGAKDFIDTLEAAEARLDPGQQQSVDILVDPITRQVVSVVPENESSIRDASTIKIRADLEKPEIPETDLKNLDLIKDLKSKNLSCVAR